MTQENVRAFSKEMFGAKYRLEIATAIGRRGVGDYVEIDDLLTELRLDSKKFSGVRKELEHLRAHRLLTRLEDAGAVKYQRGKNPYWAALPAIARSLGALRATDEPRPRSRQSQRP